MLSFPSVGKRKREESGRWDRLISIKVWGAPTFVPLCSLLSFHTTTKGLCLCLGNDKRKSPSYTHGHGILEPPEHWQKGFSRITFTVVPWALRSSILRHDTEEPREPYLIRQSYDRESYVSSTPLFGFHVLFQLTLTKWIHRIDFGRKLVGLLWGPGPDTGPFTPWFPCVKSHCKWKSQKVHIAAGNVLSVSLTEEFKTWDP